MADGQRNRRTAGPLRARPERFHRTVSRVSARTEFRTGKAIRPKCRRRKSTFRPVEFGNDRYNVFVYLRSCRTAYVERVSPFRNPTVIGFPFKLPTRIRHLVSARAIHGRIKSNRLAGNIYENAYRIYVRLRNRSAQLLRNDNYYGRTFAADVFGSATIIRRVRWIARAASVRAIFTRTAVIVPYKTKRSTDEHCRRIQKPEWRIRDVRSREHVYAGHCRPFQPLRVWHVLWFHNDFF